MFSCGPWVGGEAKKSLGPHQDLNNDINTNININIKNIHIIININTNMNNIMNIINIRLSAILFPCPGTLCTISTLALRKCNMMWPSL